MSLAPDMSVREDPSSLLQPNGDQQPKTQIRGHGSSQAKRNSVDAELDQVQGKKRGGNANFVASYTGAGTSSSEQGHAAINTSQMLLPQTKDVEIHTKEACLSDDMTCPLDGLEGREVIDLFSKQVKHLVPNHTGWFEWNKVHDLEKRHLPGFFNGKSKVQTPDLYMEYRNLIIKKYMEHPEKVLTLVDLPFITSRSIGVARQIFEFLDHWGLINCGTHINKKGEERSLLKGDTLDTSLSYKTQNTASSLSALYCFDKPQHTVKDKPTSVLLKDMLTPTLSEAQLPELPIGSQGPAVEYHCNSCTTDCSNKRYHCQKQDCSSGACERNWSSYSLIHTKIRNRLKTTQLEKLVYCRANLRLLRKLKTLAGPMQADFDLCPDCFNEGKFSMGMSALDFIVLDAVAVAETGEAGNTHEGGWTDQDTLLLLEALELFGDNWNEIAEHVATKTKAQCILHFIKMPIEDLFMKGDGALSSSLESPQSLPDTVDVNGNEEDGGEKIGKNKFVDAIHSSLSASGLLRLNQPIALSDAGNPVMSLVAFLGALVGVATDIEVRSAESTLTLIPHEDEDPALYLSASHSYVLGLSQDNPTTLSHMEAPSGKLTEHSFQFPPVIDNKASSDVEGKTEADNMPRKDVQITDEGNRSYSQLERIRNAAATTLASVAVKAKLLAEQEEQEMHHLSAKLVGTQIRKLEMKLNLFNELDTSFKRELEEIGKVKQRLHLNPSLPYGRL